MRNTKNKITLFLSCAMCICMTLCCSLPTKAAANDIICSHTKTHRESRPRGYEVYGNGHMEKTEIVEVCDNYPVCGYCVFIALQMGPLVTHSWTSSQMIEDLHNGLYMHELYCVCGYSDTTLSDSPTDPKL